MNRGFALLLTAAALLGATPYVIPAYAKDAEPAPKVPFSAFRNKPILNLLHGEGDAKTAQNTVVQAPGKALVVTPMVRPQVKPSVPAAPAPSLPQPNSVIPIPASPPVLAIDTPEAAIPEPEAPLAQAPRPPVVDEQAVPPEAATSLTFIAGIPVPPSKPPVPGADATGSGPVIERIQAVRVPTVDLPHERDYERRKAEPEEDDDAEIQPQQPGFWERLRPRERGRIDDNRTAGTLRGSDVDDGSDNRTPGLNAPPLEEAEGVSPVLLPGNTQIVASPDYVHQQQVQGGELPHEAIVFFQEKNTELEVGQLDVVENDVLKLLESRRDLRLEIVGFSEQMPEGPEATGKMAMARAMMLREYLVSRRIAPQRLTVKGKGDDTDVEPRDRVEMYFSR